MAALGVVTGQWVDLLFSLGIVGFFARDSPRERSEARSPSLSR